MKITISLCLILFGAVFAKHHVKQEKSDPECKEEHKGCLFRKGECVCGTEIGCHNPFPYINEHQCKKDLNGELDKCRKDPCEHGQCVQVRTEENYRSWECSCAGSGYHGRRCQHECPTLVRHAEIPEDYPAACVY